MRVSLLPASYFRQDTYGWRPSEEVGTSYYPGRWRVTLSKPRVAYSSVSSYTHFAGMQRFPGTGTICLRVNTAIDAIGADGGYHILSHDNGLTWGNGYVVQGSHTSAEPLTWVASANRFEGGVFAPANFAFVGGDPAYPFVGADRTKFTCPKMALGNDGASYINIGTVTFQGMPVNVGDYNPYPGVSWFGTIIQIASNNWITTVPITTQVNGPRCDSFCFKSTDGGTTWNYLSTLPFGPTEGCDEATLMQLPGGRIMFVSRVGVTNWRRSFTSDNGATWTALDTMSGGCLAPYQFALSGTVDYTIVSGRVSAASLWPAGPDANGNVPAGYIPAETGLYLSDNPDNTGWPVVDLIKHHNATIDDPSLLFSEAYPIVPPSTNGYLCAIEVAPNHLLINYDRTGVPVGLGNQVFVVDAYITRVS